MIIINIRLAIRNLLRNKVYSFLIIGGFAIGFAACILIGLFYHTEKTVNKGFTNHEQIYRIYDVKKNRCNMNWDLFPLLASDYAAIEDACPLDYQNVEELTIKAEQIKKSATINHMLGTTENFFSIFSVDLVESLSGRPFDGNESVSISSKLAGSLFGTQSPLGKQVNIGNNFFGTITSVFSELPGNSSFAADVILNNENKKFRFSGTSVNGFKYNPVNHFIKIREQASAIDLARELNKTAGLRSLDIDSLALQSLDDIYLSDLTIKSRHAKGNPTLLKIFLAIAGLILFLSSINYLNYSVSMQYAKLRMSGVKKTFGAGTGNLAMYAITEVTIGILIALLFALIITDISLGYSDFLFGKTLNIGWNDWLAIAPFILATLVVLILINSLTPVYLLAKFNIVKFLSGFTGIKNGKTIWKQALLTFQLTVSTALIAVVLIIFRQLNFVNHSDPGFDRELLIRINIPYKFPHTESFRQEIGKLPFVGSTTLSVGCPGMINLKTGSSLDENNFDVNCINVGDDYLKTMGIELINGRDFLAGDVNRSCLLNEEAFKRFGWKSFEGNRFNNSFTDDQNDGYEVIGIIKNFKFESFHQAVEPLALLYTGANEGNVLSVKINGGNTRQQIDQLTRVWKTFSSDEPFSFIFFDDFFQSMYIKEVKLARSITFFSFIAIILTCMGILGHIFMVCLTRVKEIGIRKINGAHVSDVLVILNRDFFIWVIVAVAVSSPIAFFIMRKWLENFSYKATLSWWIFALAGLLAMLITIITVSWQSWRAATRNPVEALRYE